MEKPKDLPKLNHFVYVTTDDKGEKKRVRTRDRNKPPEPSKKQNNKPDCVA